MVKHRKRPICMLTSLSLSLSLSFIDSDGDISKTNDKKTVLIHIPDDACFEDFVEDD